MLIKQALVIELSELNKMSKHQVLLSFLAIGAWFCPVNQITAEDLIGREVLIVTRKGSQSQPVLKAIAPRAMVVLKENANSVLLGQTWVPKERVVTLSDRSLESDYLNSTESLEATCNYIAHLMFKGSYAAASEILARAEEKHPTTPSVHLMDADLYLRTGRLQESIKKCNVALKMDSSLADAYVLRGQAQMELRDFDAAQEDLRQGSESGQSFELLLAFADLFRRKGDLPKSFEYLQRAESLCSMNYRSHVLRGDVYLEQGDFDLSAKAYAQAAKLAPENEIPPTRLLVLASMLPPDGMKSFPYAISPTKQKLISSKWYLSKVGNKQLPSTNVRTVVSFRIDDKLSGSLVHDAFRTDPEASKFMDHKRSSSYSIANEKVILQLSDIAVPKTSGNNQPAIPFTNTTVCQFELELQSDSLVGYLSSYMEVKGNANGFAVNNKMDVTMMFDPEFSGVVTPSQIPVKPTMLPVVFEKWRE